MTNAMVGVLVLMAIVPAIVKSSESERLAPETVAAIDAAIQQLANDDFTVRETASATLLKLGESIASALNAKLANITNAETKSRLTAIIAGWPVGKAVWTFEAGYLFGLPVVENGRVYVSNKDMTFFCLDAETGAVIWKTPIDGLMYAAPAVADGRVYVIRTLKDGRPDGTVICLSATDGSELWTWHGDDGQFFTPPLIAGGRLIFAGGDTLICLDAAKGAKLWSFDAPEWFSAASVSGDRVVVGCHNGQLYCLSAESGKQNWAYGEAGRANCGAAIVKDRVFTGDADGLLSALELGTGKPVWTFKADSRINSPPAISKGRLFTASDSGALYCLNADTGAKIWTLDTGGTIYASPSVCGDTVYVASINTKLTLRCLNTAGGAELWRFETKEAGYATPVLCGRRLFVGYHSKFYCIRTGTPGPTSWPMSGGNPERRNCNDDEQK